jgi:hypothetical protein
MNSSAFAKPIVYALYVNAAILLAILLTILGHGRPSIQTAAAQAMSDQPSIAGGNGIFVMPCQLHPEVWGCYLLDTQRQTLAVYEYRAGQQALVLSAARDFHVDLDLKNYNTFPAWYDIQKAVEEAAKDKQTNESQLHSLAPPPSRDSNP